MRPQAVKERDDEPAPDSTENGAASPADWGLDRERRGLSRETLIGLGLVGVLLCAFAFVVYKRVDQERARQAAANQKTDESAAPAGPESQDGAESLVAETPSGISSADPFEQIASTANQRNGAGATTTVEAASDVLAGSPFPSADQSPATEEAGANKNPFALEDSPSQSEPAFAAQKADDSAGAQQTAPEAFELVDLFAQPDSASEHPLSTSAGDETVGQPAGPSFEGSLSETPPAQTESPAVDFGDPFAEMASSDPGRPEALPVQSEPQLDLDPQPDASQPRELPQAMAGEFLVPTETTDTSLASPAGSATKATSGREQESAGSSTIVLGAPEELIPDEAEPVPHAEPTEPLFDQPLGSASAHAAREPAPLDPFATTPAAVAPPASAAQERQGTPPTFPNEPPAVYEVRPGDSFWIISRRQYGSARYYVALARYNARKIPDPQQIRPGMKLLVPRREILEQMYPDLFPRREANRPVDGIAGEILTAGFYMDATGRPLYRVGPKDTLAQIALHHLGRSSRWVQIYELNRSVLPDPHGLKVGAVLKLPADAGRVQAVRHEQ